MRSSFGATEDWNSEYLKQASVIVEIAVVFRGDRGLELYCDINPSANAIIAVVFRGDRGLELETVDGVECIQAIAVVFRGDRGLEQRQNASAQHRPKLRSSFGATEDWNSCGRR